LSTRWYVKVALVLTASVVMSAASTACTAVSGPIASSQRISLSGWLNVIWNGEPHFMLIDDRGTAIRLMIDDALIQSLGGVQKVNRKRVTITGERPAETPDAVRVLSLELDTERE